MTNQAKNATPIRENCRERERKGIERKHFFVPLKDINLLLQVGLKLLLLIYIASIVYLQYEIQHANMKFQHSNYTKTNNVNNSKKITDIYEEAWEKGLGEVVPGFRVEIKLVSIVVEAWENRWRIGERFEFS